MAAAPRGSGRGAIGDWDEWKNLILEGMEHIESRLDKIETKIDARARENAQRIEDISQTLHERITKLDRERVGKLETEMVLVKDRVTTRSTIWGIIGGVLAALAMILAGIAAQTFR